jgi:hypothetical protein
MIKAKSLQLALINLTVDFHHVSDWGEFFFFPFFQCLLMLLLLLLLLLLTENCWNSSTGHLFLSFLLLELILFLHAQLSLSFLTALLSLTDVFF